MRMCIAAALGGVFFVGLLPLAQAETRTVSVEDSPLGRQLAALLSEDLGSEHVVLAEQSAPLTARLKLKDTLQLTVVDADGRLVIERSFTLEHGRSTALRAAAAAVERAAVLKAPPAQAPPADPLPQPEGVESPSPSSPDPATPTVEPPPAAEPRSPPAPPAAPKKRVPQDPSPTEHDTTSTITSSRAWSLGADFGLLWAGSAPSFGVEVSGGRRLGRFGLGAVAGVYGLGCCTASVNDGTQTALEGRVLAFELLALGEWVALRSTAVEALATVSAGIERLQLSVDPSIFAGPGPTTSSNRWVFVARAGASVRGPLIGRRFWWRAKAGLQWRSGRAEIALPDGFPSAAEPLSVGRWSPVLGLGFEVILF